MLAVHLTDHVLGEAVLNATSLHFRDLVVGMRTLDFVSPLHFLSLDDQTACLGFSVFSRGEGDNKISSLFTVGLELAALRVASKLSS